VVAVAELVNPTPAGLVRIRRAGGAKGPIGIERVGLTRRGRKRSCQREGLELGEKRLRARRACLEFLIRNIGVDVGRRRVRDAAAAPKEEAPAEAPAEAAAEPAAE
jgi:hypothetical protein